jgi:hypothetical protein
VDPLLKLSEHRGVYMILPLFPLCVNRIHRKAAPSAGIYRSSLSIYYEDLQIESVGLSYMAVGLETRIIIYSIQVERPRHRRGCCRPTLDIRIPRHPKPKLRNKFQRG